jgi:putative ABC transport system permease protein
MSFIALIIKNLIRQRIRTGLTILGISMGITTVVALGVVTSSLKESMGEIIRLGGADFMVAQEGAADLAFSVVSEEDAIALGRQPGVDRAEGVLFHVGRLGSNPFFFLFGREADGLASAPPPLVDGRLWSSDSSDEVILGRRAADDVGAQVGQTVTIEKRPFEVVGIYQTGKLWEDGGAYAPMSVVRDIAAKAGVVTAVFITVELGSDPAEVADSIEKNFKNLATISDVGEVSKVDQGVDMMDAANIAISVLAVGIGAVGVMNTMIMSVLERTREIGILRAVGWNGRRILRMIIGESLFLCVIAAGVGTALGVLATRAILLIDTVRTLLIPEYTLDIFVRALIVAVVVALLGAAYPAVRAVRLTPMEALRYE